MDEIVQVVEQQITPTAVAEAPVEAKWYDTLPEQFKEKKSITRFDSLEKLLESHENATHLIGKRAQELSAEEIRGFLTPEELAAAAQSRGMPETIDQYIVPGVQEDQIPDPTAYKRFKQVAFENGITPQQAEKLIQFSMESNDQSKEQMREAWTGQVVSTYGKEAHKVLAVADKALDEFGSEAFKKELDVSGLAAHPLLVDFCYRVGQAMQQHGVPFARDAQAATDASSVQSEIKQLLDNPQFYKQWKTGAQRETDQLNALYQKLYKLETRG